MKSAFKETYLERYGLAGCVVPSLVGGIIGTLVLWFFIPSYSDQVVGMAGSVAFLYMLVGFSGGAVLGLVAAILFDRKKTREEDEMNDEF
ncbi:MAG: hypothetical protein K6A35_08055 [bacterium]|nr:hypothetical protein [bacterium]